MGRRWLFIALGVFLVIIGLGIWLNFPPTQSPSQVASPLIKNQLPSPLPRPLPDGLANNGPSLEVRPSALVASNFKAYLPLITSGGTVGPCGMVGIAADLAVLFMTDPGQLRKNITCDPRVVKAAQYRAEDMQKNRYFSHKDLQGFYPNHWVNFFGCKLPSFYPPNDNNVESIALNYQNAREAWNNLLLSEAHKVHILALDPFYRSQTVYGMGYSSGDWGKVYVILTVPPCN